MDFENLPWGLDESLGDFYTRYSGRDRYLLYGYQREEIFSDAPRKDIQAIQDLRYPFSPDFRRETMTTTANREMSSFHITGLEVEDIINFQLEGDEVHKYRVLSFEFDVDPLSSDGLYTIPYVYVAQIDGENTQNRLLKGSDPRGYIVLNKGVSIEDLTTHENILEGKILKGISIERKGSEGSLHISDLPSSPIYEHPTAESDRFKLIKTLFRSTYRLFKLQIEGDFITDRKLNYKMEDDYRLISITLTPDDNDLYMITYRNKITGVSLHLELYDPQNFYERPYTTYTCKISRETSDSEFGSIIEHICSTNKYLNDVIRVIYADDDKYIGSVIMNDNSVVTPDETGMYQVLYHVSQDKGGIRLIKPSGKELYIMYPDYLLGEAEEFIQELLSLSGED